VRLFVRSCCTEARLDCCQWEVLSDHKPQAHVHPARAQISFVLPPSTRAATSPSFLPTALLTDKQRAARASPKHTPQQCEPSTKEDGCATHTCAAAPCILPPSSLPLPGSNLCVTGGCARWSVGQSRDGAHGSEGRVKGAQQRSVRAVASTPTCMAMRPEGHCSLSCASTVFFKIRKTAKERTGMGTRKANSQNGAMLVHVVLRFRCSVAFPLPSSGLIR